MGRSRVPEDILEKLLAIKTRKLNTISDIEDALEDIKALIGQQGIDKKIRELPPEDGKPKPCPRCGRLLPVHTKNVHRQFESLSGTHTLVRHYHYCGYCNFGFCPRDAELGLPAEGNVTLKLEGRLVDFGVNDPFEICAERWSVHYPHRKFSSNLFRQVVRRVGRRLELSDRLLVQEALLPSQARQHHRLYVLNDGSLLPKVGGAWKEAKVGVLVRDEDHVGGGILGRGFVEQGRYIAVWGEQDEFREAMKSALDAERWQRYAEVIWLGDGARSNWILAETLCPLGKQILDWGHAVENGVKSGKALLGEESSLVMDWQRRIEELLSAGDVNRLVSELMDCLEETSTESQVAALDTIVGYYRHNESRMDYPRYRARGWMIGTGIAESAHRHVLQVRMKRSGQHWSEGHGRRMVLLRAAYRTAGPHQFHEAINRAALKTYRKLRTVQAKATRQVMSKATLQKAA